MKKVKLTSFGALAAFVMLTSCDESMDFGDMTGTILPNVTYDPTVIGAPGAGSRVSEDGQITVEDLTLILTPANGQPETFPNGDFPSDRSFPVGKYTLAATYGTDEEGFDQPAAYGSTEFAVTEGKTTVVELTAVASKAMVGIQYDESVLNYFTELKATLHSAAGASIDYVTKPELETRYAYVKPGEVTVDVTFTKPNGMSGTLEVARLTAEAKHRYTLGIKLGGDGAGSAGLTISFNEDLQREDITVDISDEVLTVPAPVVTLSGVEPGQRLDIVAGSPLAEPLRVDINARGGIKSAVLTTTGTALNLPAGWPAEIDLATATADQQKALTALGFKNIGIFNNPGKFAAFDLSGVVANPPATADGASPVTFALKVTDKNNKVASEEPLTFSVKVNKTELTLEAQPGYAYAGEETANVVVKYNGTADLRDVLTIKYLATTGTMKPTTIVDVQPQSRAMQTYVVTVEIPGDAQLPLTLQATAGSITTGEVEIPQASAPVVAVNANDVFAKSAWATVSSADYDVTTKNVEIQIASGNGNFVKATGEQNGADFHITGGLEPDTEYRVRAKIGALLSEPVTFTTEAATQLPNAGLDEWSKVEHKSNMVEYHVGGDVWETYNPVTISQWNSSVGNVAYVATSGTKETTDANSGGKAAVIRTVGWGSGNTASANAFNQWSFGDCKYISAGQLFLGNWEGVNIVNNAVPNYGIPFNSRPVGISFQYKYSVSNKSGNDNGDFGTAEIAVIDASGSVIARESINLGITSDYAKKTLNLSYGKNSKKASKLIVTFKSSGNPSALTANENYMKPPKPLNLSDGEYVGSQLYIDDIQLVY